MNKRLLIIKYLVLDALAASLAWGAFYIYRKCYIEDFEIGNALEDPNFIKGILLVPILWITIYTVGGLYSSVYRKSRLREFIQIFIYSIIGVLVLFFTVILDDQIKSYADYRESVGVLFLLHFALASLFRYILSSNVAHKIQNRIFGFKTLMIGAGNRAQSLYNELSTARKSEGHLFQGYLNANGKTDSNYLKALGELQDLEKVIEEQDIEEVIVALEHNDKEKVNGIMNALSGQNVVIKIIPEMYEMLTGMVKMGNVFGAVLIEVKTDILPAWQKVVKRIIDLIFSVVILILCLPLFLLFALMIKLGSKGPIFFRQERIGLQGEPFHLVKFRTMRTDAESAGPQLSKEDDPRITKFGKFLRKTRLDELPNFWNVLKGEMTLVGPRPERQYFIDKIVQQAPHYYRLQKVRPGVTSWGQVKFGYASNVDEMLERLKYDLLYLENISLLLDLKIIVYTVLIMIQGRGK